ncbi:zinc finger containing protein, putative [Babesia ovata]|uniref:Zinc finger containing protein, putative n=1 Tax=Babesia ovata TaxID=189622 RepID=A0A2H6KE09_9APIC|nr:zinc finger containing protein, putative [Babesia ovata]GBE61226.1 zinc finger containing protein, putative [Babesia ovata]
MEAQVEADAAAGHQPEDVEQATTPLVVLAYNIPADYTLYNFQDMITARYGDIGQLSIIAPFPWQDRNCCPWKIICKDRESYDKMLTVRHMWLKDETGKDSSVAITFVAGDLDDIPDIPFKEDEQLLMSEHCNVK